MARILVKKKAASATLKEKTNIAKKKSSKTVKRLKSTIRTLLKRRMR